MQVSVFIATSLDGFIARKDGDIEWLMAASAPDSTEDHGYYAFCDSVDYIIMGRHSLEKVLTFPEWPYEGKRMIVLSTTLTVVPPELTGKIELYAGSLTALMARLASEGCTRLYIDGGKTIQSFLNQGLITDMTITVIPILLGAGLPLFGKLERDIQLAHKSTQVYPSGFVTSVYEPIYTTPTPQ